MASMVASGSGGGPRGSGGGDKRRKPDSEGKTTVKRDYRKGVKKRKYDELKQKILAEMDKGARNSEIQRMYNVPESTVRSIRKQQGELKKNFAIVKKYFSPVNQDKHRVKLATEHNSIMLVVEHYLLQWINRRHTEGVSVTGANIQDQAREYYAAVVKKRQLASVPGPEFTASRGWLKRFKERMKIKHAVYKGEAQSADLEAAASFPPEAEKIIEDGGYALSQVYNCDETGVYWKRSPRATFISMAEKQARGVKMDKDRFTALLTANADGSHRMRPLILYHSKRPRAYKHANMDKLSGYIWKANAKGYMTSTISLEWFDDHFVPEAKAHCEKNNLAFRILLFMDNAPGHARLLEGRHPNVRVVFLPPNTTSKIQPMDQEVIANTKLIFYKDIHNRLRAATDSQVELLEIMRSESPEAGPSADAVRASDSDSDPDDPIPSSSSASQSLLSAKSFWKTFNIRQAVEAFVKAWQSLTVATLIHAWKPLLPNLVSSQPNRQQRQQVLSDTLDMIRQVPVPGFSDVTQQDVEELIGHLPPEESIEDMLAADDEMQVEEIAQEPQEERVKGPSAALLTRTIVSCESFVEETENLSFENKEKVVETLKTAIALLNSVVDSRIKKSQQSLITRYLQKRPQTPSEVEEVPVEVEDSADHGREPDPQAVDNLLLDAQFSGFVDEQEREQAEEMKRRDVLLRSAEQERRDTAESEERDGDGPSGGGAQ